MILGMCNYNKRPILVATEDIIDHPNLHLVGQIRALPRADRSACNHNPLCMLEADRGQPLTIDANCVFYKTISSPKPQHTLHQERWAIWGSGVVTAAVCAIAEFEQCILVRLRS